MSRSVEHFRILFPPQFEPFQAYLSGPYLKSVLAKYSLNSSVFDANLDFYGWLADRALNSAENLPRDGSLPYLCANAPEVLRLIRQAPASLDEYRWTINVLDEFLRISSPPGMRVGLTFLKVGNRYSSADLQQYIASASNVFAEYFECRSTALLGSETVETYLISAVVIDQLAAAVTFAHEIKQRRPRARVMVGGPIISRLYRQLDAVPWIHEALDAIVPGEAYRVLPSLLGLPHQYSGHVTPDLSDLDLDAYWSCRRVLPYLVAHGCKWGKCTFCSHHLTYDGYRASPMENVLNDIQALAVRHRAEYISFCDEYLTPEQLNELADGLLQRGVGVKWSTFARPEPAFRDQEFVAKLYAAGCRMLMFGLESGSQNVINAMKKGTSVKQFRPILEACKAARIAIRYDFMVGFPGETEEDVEETYRFIRDNRDVIDTPFSSYSVAVFELRSGIPVLSEPGRYHILPRDPLRGDLDDQYEFECDNGLSSVERVEWRERLIRYFKLEMDAELICPQNKTHQLILKDLCDRGLVTLPVLRFGPDDLRALRARLAAGAEVKPDQKGTRLLNHANGGELALSPALAAVIRSLSEGTGLQQAFGAQDVWDCKTFCRFVDFLYRNDYVRLDRLTVPNVSRAQIEEGAHVC